MKDDEKFHEAMPHLMSMKSSMEYFSASDTVKLFQKILQCDSNDIDKLISMTDEFNENLENVDENSYLHIHKFVVSKNEDA